MKLTYEQFKKAFYDLTSINLSLYKERQMKRRIKSLMNRSSKNSYNALIEGLKTDRDELAHFIDYITINVSEFFRNPEQWEILDKKIIPSLLSKHSKLRIWCTACSTGEEPYSLAMMLSKHISLDRINILATDIDNNVLEKARIGAYKQEVLRNIPDKLIKKFFDMDGEYAVAKKELKDTIKFAKHNLLEDPYPHGCHLVLCRNVIIYFTEEAKKFLYHSFFKALHADGFLFVGSTEQIMLPHIYNLESCVAFFYKRTNGIKQA